MNVVTARRSRSADTRAVPVVERLEAYYSRPTTTRRSHVRLSALTGSAMTRTAARMSTLAKRALDASVSGLLLLGAAPLFALVALAIRLTDQGPVLFWQTRVGRHGRTFRFPKFRTMVVDAERALDQIAHLNQHGQSVTFKMRHDPRITRVGRLLRRLSLDELPQLWCVFTGQMSLVGPRPPVPREVALYTVRDRVRLDATPGLTCTWQVSGRSEIPFEQQVELDREYVFHNNIWVDVKLLAKTVPAVLTARGAY